MKIDNLFDGKVIVTICAFFLFAMIAGLALGFEIKNTQETVEINYEKVSDNYWIQRIGENYTWYHIKYGKELNENISDLAINISDIEGIKSVYYEHYVMQIYKSPMYEWDKIDDKVKNIIDDFWDGLIVNYESEAKGDKI